jgi:hypothetical protein
VGASAEQQIEGLAMRAEAVALFNREELEASMTLN